MSDIHTREQKLPTANNRPVKVTAESIAEFLSLFIDGTSYLIREDINELHKQLNIDYNIDFLILAIHDCRLGEKPEAFRAIFYGVNEGWALLYRKHGFYKYSSRNTYNIDFVITSALIAGVPVVWDDISKTKKGKNNLVLKMAKTYGMNDGITYAYNNSGSIILCSAGVSSGKVTYEMKKLLNLLLPQLAQAAALNPNIFLDYKLNEKETKICQDLVNGKHYNAIAGDLGQSPQTIRLNMEKLCKRFYFSKASEVLAKCIELKLINPPTMPNRNW
ncbi:MAG: autoinducer binding domain-containing protein [Candidatus Sedimenticola sp. (ex Thyasira tokunagai)]